MMKSDGCHKFFLSFNTGEPSEAILPGVGERTTHSSHHDGRLGVQVMGGA